MVWLRTRTWLSKAGEVENAVRKALDVGYKAIDWYANLGEEGGLWRRVDGWMDMRACLCPVL